MVQQSIQHGRYLHRIGEDLSPSAEVLVGGDNQRKRAAKYFDKEDWVNSRQHYREAISYYKKAGEKDNSELIALCRYNIAITYWNQKNWSKAREKLEELLRKHPNHMKEEVADMIYKIGRFGY